MCVCVCVCVCVNGAHNACVFCAEPAWDGQKSGAFACVSGHAGREGERYLGEKGIVGGGIEGHRQELLGPPSAFLLQELRGDDA
jgi:hypothetical protein